MCGITWKVSLCTGLLGFAIGKKRCLGLLCSQCHLYLDYFRFYMTVKFLNSLHNYVLVTFSIFAVLLH